MQREGFRVTAEFEEAHWWFRSRRELVALQLRRAAAEQGFPGRPLRLLDYGCGTGRNLRLLREFGDTFGADVANPHAPDFRVAGELPILDLAGDLSGHFGRFQVLTALDVLEHLEDDVGGLRQMADLLAPGGAMILTVPAYDWLWSGEDVISEHRRRYTRRSLADACRRADLEIRFLSHFNLAVLPPMTAVVWAHRLWDRNGEPRSNLQPTAGASNSALTWITSLEARLVGREQLRLPAGASLVCRCTTPIR